MWENSRMQRFVERTAERPVPHRPQTARRTGGRWWLLPVALVLSTLAFLLLPTGQANTRHLVEINGLVVSVVPSATIEEVAGGTLALARPGSDLDITGDVTGMGLASPPDMTMNGRPAAEAATFSDGAVVGVSHGAHRLEGITKKEQSIPFETVTEGKGAVITLVQEGTAGARETYLGDRSGKQAALFTLATPQNAIIRRTSSAKPDQKLVALTFDDGPGKYTQGVLEALAAKHVPATFFVLGSSAARNPGMIEKMKTAGHEVENHTWSHPILTKVSAETLKSEITRTSSAIGGSRFLRPPYGTYDAAVTTAAASLGHRLVLWTVDTLDWKSRDADAILAKVKAGTKPGAIILMHDGGADRAQTVVAIPRVVDWLFANGYSLTTVAKLLQR
jgi:peptidoglycan/xylan/chitin deacetylase (PgdA/CDA1 family)